MSARVEFRTNRATVAEIAEHLSSANEDFVPALSGRVAIPEYAEKLVSNAVRFEAWSEDRLVGLVAAYANDHERRIAYITSVSVLETRRGEGIAIQLLERCIGHARDAGMGRIALEVDSANAPAIELYKRLGFAAGKTTPSLVSMELALDGGSNEHQA